MELRKSPVLTKIRLDQQLRIQLSVSIKVDLQKRQLRDREIKRTKRPGFAVAGRESRASVLYGLFEVRPSNPTDPQGRTSMGYGISPLELLNSFFLTIILFHLFRF